MVVADRGGKMKQLILSAIIAGLLAGCYFEEDDISSSDRPAEPQYGQAEPPSSRLLPGEQVMASGRYRSQVQIANGAATVNDASSENYSASMEASVIR